MVLLCLVTGKRLARHDQEVDAMGCHTVIIVPLSSAHGKCESSLHHVDVVELVFLYSNAMTGFSEVRPKALIMGV